MDVRIPRFDHRKQYKAIRAEVLQALDEVIESGCLILGPKVRAFEVQMCNFLNASDGHSVGVGNGTDALAIALRALNVGRGDEVVTVANTAVATVSAIRMVGAIPVFCDIDPETLLMDPQSAQGRITNLTKAIIPVHLFGNAADMVAIMRLANRYGIRVVEDCAQSCGTLLHNRPTGTWGDIGCFSFYPTKNLAAYGDGGLCFTRNWQLADAMRQIASYGCSTNQVADREGVNSRLDELQAAVLEIKLRHLPEYLRQRKRVASAYRQHLSSKCRIPKTTTGAEHSHHLFVVQVEQREHVISMLRSAGVEPGIHYATPIHRMSAYRFLETREGLLPFTEKAAERVLSLPCYPELSLEAVEEVCSVVNNAIAN